MCSLETMSILSGCFFTNHTHTESHRWPRVYVRLGYNLIQKCLLTWHLYKEIQLILFVELLMFWFRRQNLKRSQMFLAMAASLKGVFSSKGDAFGKRQHSLGCVSSGIVPSKPTALLVVTSCRHLYIVLLEEWSCFLLPVLFLFLSPVAQEVQRSGVWYGGYLGFRSGALIPQNAGLFSGWFIASDSGFQSGWKKWILNVRAQFLKTRFSVIKRWWLPFRPRSWERYIVHSSGPKGS